LKVDKSVNPVVLRLREEIFNNKEKLKEFGEKYQIPLEEVEKSFPKKRKISETEEKEEKEVNKELKKRIYKNISEQEEEIQKSKKIKKEKKTFSEAFKEIFDENQNGIDLKELMKRIYKIVECKSKDKMKRLKDEISKEEWLIIKDTMVYIKAEDDEKKEEEEKVSKSETPVKTRKNKVDTPSSSGRKKIKKKVLEENNEIEMKLKEEELKIQNNEINKKHNEEIPKSLEGSVQNIEPKETIIYKIHDTVKDVQYTDKVSDHIDRFGTIIKKNRRGYRGDKKIPDFIQFFIDINFSGKIFKSKKFDLKKFTFQREFVIDDISDFEWLAQNDDHILFGDGDAMICAKQEDETQDKKDFNIYLIYDCQIRIITLGPFKLSEFLDSLEIENENLE
jgi:hypothetical protein